MRALTAVCIVLAVAAGSCGGRDDEPPRPVPTGDAIPVDGGVATPYGRDAGRVWVLTPTTGEVESVVVYLHGWGARLPFEWHLVWLEHLLSHGSAVLFPEYQDGVDDAFVVAPYDLRVGLQLGFRALREQGVPVVAAGFSVGATLAFVYAAAADAWDVPKPQAVYSIFPVDPLQIDPALDLSGLHETRVVLLVGDRDDIAGRYGADALVENLGSLPPRLLEYGVVRTTDELIADHEAPTYVDDPAVRATFWQPLDELVDAAR
jgi:acetyl esterase/lipase